MIALHGRFDHLSRKLRSFIYDRIKIPHCHHANMVLISSILPGLSDGRISAYRLSSDQKERNDDYTDLFDSDSG